MPEPALAKVCHEPFFADGCIYERKLDGERCLAVCDDSGVTLWSRNGREADTNYPELADALSAQPATGYVLDGEVVAFDGSQTSFAKLQPRIQLRDTERARESQVSVYYYIFDLLRADGNDVRDRGLLDRKRALRELLTFDDPLRYTQHRDTADEGYLDDVCRRGWEGLIAKQADAPYRSGRTDAWLKFKCEASQELVIVGYTDPSGQRIGFGALLVGYYDGDDLVYAGKVGTGFSDDVLRDLTGRLSAREVAASPCDRGRLPSSGVHWVRPELVAQVAFTEWTRAGQLRHPRYLGLRRDKPAPDVVRET